MFEKIKGKNMIRKPTPVSQEKTKQENKSKFCVHHQDYSHTIENCRNFKTRIEMDIGSGNLSEFVQRKDKQTKLVIAPSNHINVTFSRVEHIFNPNKKMDQLHEI